MNISFYLEKLRDSKEFKDFIKKNSKAYMCSAFFIIDYEKFENKQHLDFYSPNTKEIFSFKLEDGIKKEVLNNYNEKVLEKLSLNYEIEFEEIEKILNKKMDKEKVTNKIQKILISLQKFENKDLLTLTVFISGLGILKVIIDPVEKKVLEFEKKSFFDMLKFVKKG